MKRLIASPSAWLVAAACTAHAPKTVSNEASGGLDFEHSVTAEWSIANDGNSVTVAVRIYNQRFALGTYLGRVYPPWQSYCDVKMGILPAPNVDYAKLKGAVAKLTVVNDGAHSEEPTPPGSTSFFVKRPSPNRVEIWKQDTRVAVVAVWPNASFDEEIDDDDGKPGFDCGLGDSLAM